MKKVLLMLLSSLLFLLAFANVAMASNTWGYQPELPEALKK